MNLGQTSILLMLFTGTNYTPCGAILIVKFKLPEQQPKGSIVGHIIEQLPMDLRMQPSNRFRSLHEEESKYFRIDPVTSQLSVAEVIDRETVCPGPSYAARSTATDTELFSFTRCELSFRVNLLRVTNSSVRIVNMLRIYVEVEDIDDQACTFTPSNLQHIQIKENLDKVKMPLHRPVDLDAKAENSILKSTINILSINMPTNIIQREGLFELIIGETFAVNSPYSIELLINEPLDYEVSHEVGLVVTAGDAAKNRSCTLYVVIHIEDENDNPPRFMEKSVHITIPENASRSVPIYTPKASDRDAGPVYGLLSFRLSPFNAAAILSTFYVNPKNGSVFILKRLKYAQQANYKLILEVHNFEVAPDPHRSGTYTEEGAEPITEQYALRDQMELRIELIDVNDNSPVIRIYSVNGSNVLAIPEHADSLPADVAVVSVTDEDVQANNQITCRLDDESTRHFQLTSISEDRPAQASDGRGVMQESYGIMYKLSTLHAFDRETDEHVQFAVICDDNGVPVQRSSVTSILHIHDINDNSPWFSTTSIHLTLSEDSDPVRRENNYYVIQLNATDADIGENGHVSYTFVSEDTSELFHVDANTGIVHTTGLLDREKKLGFNFTVVASDNGIPPKSGTITILIDLTDYNDNAPEFQESKYDFSIAEDVPIGHLVGTVVACDNDIGPNAALKFYLIYSMESNGSAILHDRYELVSDTAEEPFRLRYEKSTKPNCYSVMVLTNTQLDRESMIDEYPVTPGKQFLKEGINPRQPYETERIAMYTMKMIAEDNGSPRLVASIPLSINITDVNDESPIFIFPGPEQRYLTYSCYGKPGSEVLRVLATDMDEGPNGTVEYSLEQLELYDVKRADASIKTCQKRWTWRTISTENLRVNLHEYFKVDDNTGDVVLDKELPDALIGLTVKLTVIASDMGPVERRRTPIDVCVKITDAPVIQDNFSIAGYLRWSGRQGKAVFYGYVIVGVLISSLIASIAFVALFYFAWHRSRSQKKGRGISVVKSGDVEHRSLTPNEVDLGHAIENAVYGTMKVQQSALQWSSIDTDGPYEHSLQDVLRYTDVDQFNPFPMGNTGMTIAWDESLGTQRSSSNRYPAEQYGFATYNLGNHTVFNSYLTDSVTGKSGTRY
ncbi:unnamed protein product [Dicrocoelium dendriticum]|nr:unnamed protein product [Dicrocoelium dendriticum]